MASGRGSRVSTRPPTAGCRRDVSVLDIGCGFGQTLAYHAARGCDAHGIDADANLLRVAERFGLNARVGLFHAEDYEPDRLRLRHARPGHRARRRPERLPERRRDGPPARRHRDRVHAEFAQHGRAPRPTVDQLARPVPSPAILAAFVDELAEDAGLNVICLRTHTNTGWLHRQWLHLASHPREGVPSPYWDPRNRRRRTMRRRRVRFVNALARAGVFVILTRLADATGGGDNLLCILRKPT